MGLLKHMKSNARETGPSKNLKNDSKKEGHSMQKSCQPSKTELITKRRAILTYTLCFTVKTKQHGMWEKKTKKSEINRPSSLRHFP